MPDVWKDPIPSLISIFQDEQSPLDVSLSDLLVGQAPRLQKFFFMLNSAMHEILTADQYQNSQNQRTFQL